MVFSMTIEWEDGSVLIEPNYPLECRIEDFFLKVFNRERKLLIKHYEDIIGYMSRNDDRLSWIQYQYEDKKHWRSSAKYYGGDEIEKLFRHPMGDMPLYINNEVPFIALAAQWRLQNGI